MDRFNKMLKELGYGKLKRLLLTRKLKKFGESTFKKDGIRYKYIVIGG